MATKSFFPFIPKNFAFAGLKLYFPDTYKHDTKKLEVWKAIAFYVYPRDVMLKCLLNRGLEKKTIGAEHEL